MTFNAIRKIDDFINPDFLIKQLLFTTIVLILSVVIIFSLAKLTWLLIYGVGYEITPDDTLTGSNTTNLASRSIDDTIISKIAALHLFGEAATLTSNEQIQSYEIPPLTNLKLNLHGIKTATGKIQSSAIIEGLDGKHEAYYSGDELPVESGVVLEAIYPQFIIIKRNNQFESLNLFTDKNNSPLVEHNKGNKNTYDDRTSNPSVNEILREYRKRLQNNPLSLSKVLKIDPVAEEDKVLGYKLNPGSDRQFFKDLGLETNDIVTSVNGIGFNTPRNIFMVINELSSANELEVIVSRKGKNLSLFYNLQ